MSTAAIAIGWSVTAIACLVYGYLKGFRHGWDDRDDIGMPRKGDLP